MWRAVQVWQIAVRLRRLEIELGFRSSFNFVPEGSYRVPAELREELTAMRI